MKKKIMGIIGLFIAIIMVATVIASPLVAAYGNSYKGSFDVQTKQKGGPHGFSPPKALQPSEEFKIGQYSGILTENGIENLCYKNEEIVSKIILGDFIRGGIVGNSMFLAYSNGYIAINKEVLTLKARDVTIYLSAEIVKKTHGIAVLRTEEITYLARYFGEWNYDEMNNTISGSGVIVLHPAPKLERLAFIHRITSWNITDSGIENISIANHDVLSIRFDATTFLGSVGRFNEVLFWDSAKAHVLESPHGVMFDIFSENITIEVANDIEIVQVTPTIVILTYNNSTCGVITGRLEVSRDNITAHKFVKVVVGPKLIENMFRVRHRYRDVLTINDSGEFSGRYVEGVFSDTQITNYTIRGITVAEAIDLSEILGNDYNIAKHGATIHITGENGQINIVDSVTGPIIVRNVSAATITVKIPEDNVTLEEINDTKVVYRVEDVRVMINVYNGAIEVDGSYIYIALENNGVFVLHCPPVHGVKSEAMIKLYGDEGLRADANALRPDINVNAQISGNRIVAKVSGHGEGTVMDIELDPSTGISPENVSDVSVFFDGKEINLRPIDEISSTTEPSYSVYFDGESLHLLVAIPHFSEHTIEVVLPGMAATVGDTPTPTETPTPTPKDESINKEIIVGGTIAAIVIVGIIAGILVRRR
ncbi:MAG TPA: hypothetical protein ENI59_00780 [Euryarchaeota archaeon]|nr:hypothetical protein [Euryarchaeota archaeon]